MSSPCATVFQSHIDDVNVSIRDALFWCKAMVGIVALPTAQTSSLRTENTSQKKKKTKPKSISLPQLAVSILRKQL